MRPGGLDLAGGRWVPFVCTIAMKGVDLTGATFALQVRQAADTPGTPLADLGTVSSASTEGVRVVYAGTDTIANHVAAGRMKIIPVGKTGADSLALSLLGVRINKSTMTAMPYPGERGSDATLAWDIQITPSGGIAQVWLRGKFTVEAGVVQ